MDRSADARRTQRRDLRAGIPVGSVGGIAVRLDPSVLVIFLLLTWSLATQLLPESAGGESTAVYWLAGVATSVLFLGSLLAHELSHSLVARGRGVRVRDITLWLFGGVATLEGEAHTPRDELAIAVAGPASSLAIGVVAFASSVAMDAAGGPEVAVVALQWLGLVNAVLAVFNLAPGAPLDGGRVLRALLWKRHGDRARASISAARAGRVVGAVLVGAGLVELAYGWPSGLWFVFLGWFLMNAARSEEAQTAVLRDLAGVHVRDVMTPAPVVVPAGTSVDSVLHDWVLRAHCSSFPVAGADGAIVGLVTLSRLKGVAPAARASTPVARVAWPIDEVVRAAPGDEVVDVARRLGASGDAGDGRVLVFEDERLVGIVSPTDFARLVQLTESARARTRRRDAA